MRRKMHGRTFAIVLAAVTVGAATGMTPSAHAAPPGRSSDELKLLAAMNTARVAKGLPRLKVNGVLAAPARTHSAALAGTGELDHDGPNGEPFWKRLVAAGYPRNSWMGENLALWPDCTWSPATVVRMWLQSPGHRANLLSKKFRVVGVGIASNAGCTATVFTTDFGG